MISGRYDAVMRDEPEAATEPVELIETRRVVRENPPPPPVFEDYGTDSVGVAFFAFTVMLLFVAYLTGC